MERSARQTKDRIDSAWCTLGRVTEALGGNESCGHFSHLDQIDWKEARAKEENMNPGNPESARHSVIISIFFYITSHQTEN